ncbi:MAG: aldehyde ferredoxin oxidoreductase family protein [Thermoprotei archaeon]
MNLPAKVLYVDLTRKTFLIEDRKDLFENYIGGVGVASKILLEECPKGADPLGPENPIIFAIGPLTGLFPLASKTVAMFKSPLTGNLGESHAGGRSAVAIRMAGYGAIVIKGASEYPVYLSIYDNKVYFRDASALWGVRSSFTVGRVLRELEPNPGFRTIMRIGRAGENLIRYASVITETYRHFGRLGLGAVFGSKKLKAIVISGSSTIKVNDMKKYREIYDTIYNLSVKSPAMKKYHDLGTPANVNPLNLMKALPTMNLTSSYFDKAEEISGETLTEKYLGRRVACGHCPTACIHIAALREPYEDEPYFYKTTMISYDYELIYSLGSMLGIGNPEGLLKLIDEVEIQGLDAISTGVVLAWSTEMFKKGLISEKETNNLKLEWGDYQTYIKAVRFIVNQINDFYKTLARGVEYASSIYGGKEFALAFGSNEMAGYHTGPLFYGTLLTGARHSHLDSAGYSFDEKNVKTRTIPSPEEGASAILNEEIWRQILTSLVICLFARGIYDEKIVKEALSVVGLNMDTTLLKQKGLDILRMKYEFKIREGFDPKILRIPKRITEVETPLGKIDENYLRSLINEYFSKLYSIQ